MADWNDRPLADAKRRLRDQARAQRRHDAEYAKQVQAVESGVPLPPPPLTGAELVSSMRAAQTVRDRKLAAVRALFERIAGQCSTLRLDRLIGALEMFERGLTRRDRRVD
jgi:hypothetical protein